MKKLLSAILCCALACALACGCTERGKDPSGGIADTAAGTAGAGTAENEENTENKTEETEMTVTEPMKEPVTLRVATYNIKHAAEGIDKIAAVLKEADADIVGIQEADYLNSRSPNQDQPKLIAKAAGYEYYEFTPAIDYKGGKYGTAVLSKYPIDSFEVTKLDAKGNEGRAVGHAVIDVGGVKVDFFNTHLSYEEKSIRTGQFEDVAAMLEKCGHFILTADFNTQDFSEFSVLGASVMVNRADSRHVTFPGSSSAIDNILASGSFTELRTETIVSGASDHYLMWTEFEFRP